MEKKMHTMFPTVAVQPPIAAKAKGAVITDVTGKEYLDFSSGVAVVNIGHGVEEIKEAVVEQMHFIRFGEVWIFRQKGWKGMLYERGLRGICIPKSLQGHCLIWRR